MQCAWLLVALIALQCVFRNVGIIVKLCIFWQKRVSEMAFAFTSVILICSTLCTGMPSCLLLIIS